MPATTNNVVAKKFLAEKRVFVSKARKEHFVDGVNLHKSGEAATEYIKKIAAENVGQAVPYIVWVPTLVVHPEPTTATVINIRERKVGADGESEE